MPHSDEGVGCGNLFLLCVFVRKYRGGGRRPEGLDNICIRNTPSPMALPYLVSLAGAEKITLRHAPRGVEVTFCSSVCRRHIGELSLMVTEGLKTSTGVERLTQSRW